MKYFGLALAFMLAGAAAASELSYEAPPSNQVLTPVSAFDWTGLYFSARATGSFANSDTLFSVPTAPLPLAGSLGSPWPNEDIQTEEFVSRVATDQNRPVVQVAAEDAASGTGLGEPNQVGTTEDPNGRLTLGVDISNVGSTPTRVRRFLVGLPADAASKVRSGCAAVMGDQSRYHPRLLEFCTILPEKSIGTVN